MDAVVNGTHESGEVTIMERIEGVERPASLRGYDARAHSDATAVEVGSESLVQQHFADEVDINTIMRRFGATRELPFGPDTGIYGDFTGISDYESAVARVEGARERFMALPATVRERFDNDPGVLIRAANELPEAEFLGLFAEEVAAPVASAPSASGGIVPPGDSGS